MINESGELVTPENPVESELPEAPKVETPAPVIVDANSDLTEKNKQLFERAKKAETAEKELKERVKELENQQVPSDSFVYGNEDKTAQEVSDLTRRLDEIEDKQELDALYAKFPVIKDKLEEFNTFRQDYPRHKLENIAKLFLAENDLLEAPPAREGLEKPTSGARVAPTSKKMSVDDVRRLRETNYEEYRKMVKEGRIDLSE